MAEVVSVTRDSVIAVVADHQACGSCAGAPEHGPWCQACQDEADALIAAFPHLIGTVRLIGVAYHHDESKSVFAKPVETKHRYEVDGEWRKP